MSSLFWGWSCLEIAESGRSAEGGVMDGFKTGLAILCFSYATLMGVAAAWVYLPWWVALGVTVAIGGSALAVFR